MKTPARSASPRRAVSALTPAPSRASEARSSALELEPRGNIAPLVSPSLLYLSSLSRGSRATQASALRDVAAFLQADPMRLDWARLGYAETTAVRSHLAAKYAPSTARRYLCALRGVLRQCRRLGLMTQEAYERATDLDPIRGERELVGRALSRAELRAALAACAGEGVIGARNRCLVALLYGCGLRRAELCGLDLGDVSAEAVQVRHGKGDKSRTVYVPSSAAPALEAWLSVRGDEPGPFLWPTSGGKPGRIRALCPRRLNPASIGAALRGLAQRAAVAHFSAHDLRRTYAGDLLDERIDLSTVQKLMGHASPTTTARYDRRPERARQAAAETIVVPL